MSESEIFDQSVLEFRDEYLKSRRDVSIFRKLRVYSQLGLYVTGILTYITLALYFADEITRYSSPVIGLGIASVISAVLTILFRINKARRYQFNDIDLVYHEIAAFIDKIENSTDGDISEAAGRFDNRVIDDDDGVLPKVWRDELREYFDYLDGSDDVPPESLNTVFSQLVSDVEQFSDVDLSEEYSQKEEDTSLQGEAGFLGVLFDTISSDIVSRQTLIWIVFALAVAGGLALAFFHGQGWGVLLVTIVFGGLRLYDQRTDK